MKKRNENVVVSKVIRILLVKHRIWRPFFQRVRSLLSFVDQQNILVGKFSFLQRAEDTEFTLIDMIKILVTTIAGLVGSWWISRRRGDDNWHWFVTFTIDLSLKTRTVQCLTITLTVGDHRRASARFWRAVWDWICFIVESSLLVVGRRKRKRTAWCGELRWKAVGRDRRVIVRRRWWRSVSLQRSFYFRILGKKITKVEINLNSCAVWRVGFLGKLFPSQHLDVKSQP